MFSRSNKKNINTLWLKKSALSEAMFCCLHILVSILHKSITGCYRPVRVANGPIMSHYRFIKNANWDICPEDPLLHVQLI